MKIIRLFTFYLYIAILSFSFYACSNDDEPEPAEKVFIEIKKAGYSISAKEQMVEVRIHTNIKVNVSIEYSEEDKGWINVSSVEEAGEDLTYQLNVKENTKSSQRTGNIVFTPVANTTISIDTKIDGNTIVITQAGAEP